MSGQSEAHANDLGTWTCPTTFQYSEYALESIPQNTLNLTPLLIFNLYPQKQTTLLHDNITFPGGFESENTMQNHNHIREKSFVIRIDQNITTTHTPSLEALQYSPQSNFNFSAMKIFNRFRKLLMRLILSLPSRGSSSSSATPQNGDVRFDPPKTSCSSYYSSHSHYNEAIADCIEFFNKSSQEGVLDGRKSSDILVWYIYIYILYGPFGDLRRHKYWFAIYGFAFFFLLA